SCRSRSSIFAKRYGCFCSPLPAIRRWPRSSPGSSAGCCRAPEVKGKMAGAKQQTQNQAKVFSRRVAILGGLQTTLVGALISRLYYLQVVQADKYRLLAEENRIN